LKIKIAIINLTSGGLSGGYVEYLLNMIPLLSAHKNVDSILYAAPKEFDFKNSFNSLHKLKIVYCNPFSPLKMRQDRTLIKNLDEFMPDIIFVPLARHFKYKNIPIVTMLQNMEPFVKRHTLNSFKTNIKLFFQRFIGERALIKSDGIIFLSKYVKNFIENELQIKNKKTSLIYHGVNNNLYLDKNNDNMKDEFIFTAGSIRPARGLEDLIKASYLLKKDNINLNINIAGSVNSESKKYLQYLKKLIQKNKLSNSVKFLGRISKKEMNWYYRNSKIFVMTSHVESFGMIACEAMSNGCFCISSDSSCLPEIFKDSALYYKKGDSKGLARKIKKSINLSNLDRKKKIHTAIERSSQYSWNITCEKTVELFLSIINEK
tara:strand:+ start:506 stop:1633 length:1128 start_codon:yes stop_codon:yes gene_type:complete